MAAWNAIRWTPDQDEAIRRVYDLSDFGGNQRLARKWNTSPRNISARAAKLGLPPLIHKSYHGKYVTWHDDEIDLVRSHSGEPTAQIRARLYSAGHSRSLQAIRSVVSKLRLNGDIPDREAYYEDQGQITMHAIVKGLGINEWVIDSWIRKGWLKARERPKNTIVTIHYRDLRKFLIDYVAYWDHRKADRFFLVDVLTNKIAEHG